jgi:hypothetical protein
MRRAGLPVPTDLTDRPSILRNPAMRVRRHRSFRPTLDVLPGRIAPSSASGLAPAAVAATPTPAPSSDPAYYSLFDDNTPWSLATPSPAVDPS